MKCRLDIKFFLTIKQEKISKFETQFFTNDVHFVHPMQYIYILKVKLPNNVKLYNILINLMFIDLPNIFHW